MLNKLPIKFTSIAHYVGGFLAALIVLSQPILTILLTALFLVYELNEDWYLTDEAFKDIREYMVGSFVAALVIFATDTVAILLV